MLKNEAGFSLGLAHRSLHDSRPSQLAAHLGSAVVEPFRSAVLGFPVKSNVVSAPTRATFKGETNGLKNVIYYRRRPPIRHVIARAWNQNALRSDCSTGFLSLPPRFWKSHLLQEAHLFVMWSIKYYVRNLKGVSLRIPTCEKWSPYYSSPQH